MAGRRRAGLAVNRYRRAAPRPCKGTPPASAADHRVRPPSACGLGGRDQLGEGRRPRGPLSRDPLRNVWASYFCYLLYVVVTVVFIIKYCSCCFVVVCNVWTSYARFAQRQSTLAGSPRIDKNMGLPFDPFDSVLIWFEPPNFERNGCGRGTWRIATIMWACSHRATDGNGQHALYKRFIRGLSAGSTAAFLVWKLD